MNRLRTSIVALLLASLTAASAAEPDDCPRDWSGIDLAWRGDPRAPADTPGRLERPMSRRAARRARRAAARDWRVVEPAVIEPPPAESSDPETPAAECLTEGPAEEIVPPAGSRELRDISYSAADHPRQRFDLYLPADASGGEPPRPIPLVIWIHGETWRDGSKDDCPLKWLVQEGYAVASIGYRLTDTAVFPAQLEDCLAAIDHLRTNAATWNLDSGRIAVAGSAAGGHLAALVGLAEESVAGEPRSSVRGVCVVSAPTLLTALGPAQDRAGSPASLLVGGPLPEFREAAQRASPMTHVSAGAPPFLIVHARGGGDETAALPIEQSRQFDDALRAAGAESTLVMVQWEKGRSALAKDSPAARSLVEFLSRSFGPATGT